MRTNLREGEREPNTEPSPLEIIERALVDSPSVTSEQAERATEWLAGLMRSEWASRVLDKATAHLGDSRDAYPNSGIEGEALVKEAALVWPTLPAEVRSELGECP